MKLSILIPTFNRCNKLVRLLNCIKDEVEAYQLGNLVNVYVSDNASTDDTEKLAREFRGNRLDVHYFRQSENVGFDRNLRFLYQKAESEYVWFMADDDLPLKGAIANIARTIETHDPDVLLFSFIQPPGSKNRQFDYSDPIHIVTDPVDAIEHVLRYTKLSIFVLRNIAFSEIQWQELDRNIGGWWYYLSLAFSVLESSRHLCLVVLSDPLAACDEDYTTIAWDPTPFLNLDKPVQHPFVMKHRPEVMKRFPDLLRFFDEDGYYNAILCSFAAKSGSITPESTADDYDEFIKALDFRAVKLLKRPRSLLQFIALKCRIAGLWPHIRPAVRRVKTLLL